MWYNMGAMDINAARNIRNRYTVSQGGGPSSTGPVGARHAVPLL